LSALEEYAARAVASASLFERAVHHEGPWHIRLDGHATRPAARHVGREGVVIFALFGDDCRPQRVRVAELLCDGELVHVREVELPDEPEFDVRWHFQLPAGVVA
jgi:hypothetical protein